MDIEVNKRIRQLRKDKGLKQSDVGKILGIKANTYSMFERKGKVSTAVLKKLADFYNVDVKYILYGEEAEVPQITEPPKIKPEEPKIIFSYNEDVFPISILESTIIKNFRNFNKKDKQELIDLINRKISKK